MRLTDNVILVTGGSSGIGLALAEALHNLGNKVIIAGRREDRLQAAVAANPGMDFIVLDISDADSIAHVARQIIADFPAINTLINCAGIQRNDQAGGAIDDQVLTDSVSTNLLGPIRMTSAFIEHFRTLDTATIIYVSSMLAYLPLSQVSIYCATKAALHSFAMSQRYQLRDSNIAVLEIAPPYVQTDLMNGKSDDRAMPLDQYIQETMDVLGSDAVEILVPLAKARRDQLRTGEIQAMAAFNDMMGVV